MRRWHRYGTRSHFGLKLLTFIVLISAFILMLDSAFRPVIKSITTNQARMKSVEVINRAISEELNKNAVSYNDLVTIDRDSSGKVLADGSNEPVEIRGDCGCSERTRRRFPYRHGRSSGNPPRKRPGAWAGAEYTASVNAFRFCERGVQKYL